MILSFLAVMSKDTRNPQRTTCANIHIYNILAVHSSVQPDL